jgi:hypothetical protein
VDTPSRLRPSIIATASLRASQVSRYIRGVLRLLLLASSVAVSGCTCGRAAPVALDAAPAVPASAVEPPKFDLDLQRTALIAFGNTTPLPVSEEFTEEVPALRPPLERASQQRPNAPLRLRVARDVPYGQLTRMMQSALAFRVVAWEVFFEHGGQLQRVQLLAPGPIPRGNCWARAWVGPDARVQLGVDVEGKPGEGMRGVLVLAKDGEPNGALAATVLRRMDARCKDGQVRLYSQATARSGPTLALARALATATPAVHLAELVLAVPSIGAQDTPDELAK